MKDNEILKNPRVIVVQKLYTHHINNDTELTFPKHRYKKFIKDVVNGTIERKELIQDFINKELKNDINDNRKKVLKKSLDVLNDKEKHIILKRHLNYSPLTLESVGKDLNISKERVRQLESRALLKLKKRILKITSKQDLI